MRQRTIALCSAIAMLITMSASLGSAAPKTRAGDEDAAEAPKVVVPPQPGKEPISGRIRWDSKDDAKRYAKADWDRITTPRFAGFTPPAQIVEKKTQACSGKERGSYLRTEGALCRTGVWLEVKGEPGRKIDSLEKLQKRFAPVESEAEAVSFVAATGFDLKWKTPEILEGHVLAIGDGYLVQAVARNTFGCRAHAPTAIVFKVTSAGDIKQIALEPEPDPVGPTMCVD